MSETQFIIGKMKPLEGNPLVVAKEILKKRSKEVASYYDDELECLVDVYYNEFFYHPKTNKLYQIITQKDYEYEDVAEIKVLDSGIVEFTMKFYNGGTCLSQLLEDCLDEKTTN